MNLKQHITEAKNTHMTHIEDMVIDGGVQGARAAIFALRDLRDMLAGHTNDTKQVTVKWDGAPAVFAGPHPETGKFFVATKSLFRKRNAEGAIYYSDADITADKSGELANKLKVSLAEFSKLGMKEILQGDLMFTDDVSTTDIDGKFTLEFYFD